jgi:hypothetical protein
MGKQITPRNLRSIGSEIDEVLRNAVAYSKGDTSKGRHSKSLCQSGST